MTTDRYTVVENAGYERECDIRSFASYQDAIAFIKRNYTDEERDMADDACLHPAVRLDKANGEQTYEI